MESKCAWLRCLWSFLIKIVLWTWILVSLWPCFPNTLNFITCFQVINVILNLKMKKKVGKLCHMSTRVSMINIGIDKMLLKDIKELTRHPRICWNKIWKKTRSQTYKLRHSKHTYPMSIRGCSSRSSWKAKQCFWWSCGTGEIEVKIRNFLTEEQE